MWVLRAYDENSDELVAEHELRAVDQRALTRILGFMPSAFLSTPLSQDLFLDFDAPEQHERQP
jgi:hypothetical protein